MQPDKWDIRGLRIAREVAGWSKDPSTQAGCYIADVNHGPVSHGFNGFPRGVADDHRLEDREVKYEMILHAEVNATLFAQKVLEGCTAYVWPFGPCTRCAAVLIQAGISRIVTTNWVQSRWRTVCFESRAMLHEAGVELVLINQHGELAHVIHTSEEPCLPSI